MASTTADPMPDLTMTTHTGTSVTLSDLVSDGPIVLFFYPKAGTSGCTAEACHFRDLAAEFEEAGARRYGVRRDDVAAHAEFASDNELDFPLLADEDGAIAKAFGAKRPGSLWSKRQTFVIGTDRRVLGAIHSETDMETHADQALELLRTR